MGRVTKDAELAKGKGVSAEEKDRIPVREMRSFGAVTFAVR